MPRAGICGEPGCSALVPSGVSYCARHVKEPRRPFASAVRRNAGLYATAQWRRLRKAVLERQPFCARCGIGRDEAALHVHHIIPPMGNAEAFFNGANLTVLCGRCHGLETARETRGRRNG